MATPGQGEGGQVSLRGFAKISTLQQNVGVSNYRTFTNGSYTVLFCWSTLCNYKRITWNLYLFSDGANMLKVEIK
ncbi:hypothetical protein CMV_010244 [Castanea mollissima]|uniref:Uncharacterized protein n=1 Tax=Castanea mollissima TaxID=60419 RepID=A0A8J4VPT3_9ROSI|nr:hypothetical protein CMV_010244 [Castanea mollissima]